MIVISLLLVGLSAIGLGLPLLSLLMRQSDRHVVTLGDAGIAGLFIMALLGTLLHLVLPLGGAHMALVPVAGLVGLITTRHLARQAAQAFWRDEQVRFLALATLAAVALLMRFKGAGFYDTGLYHLQQILMQADDPIILGAANIHMRFGYNSLLYVISGMGFLPGLGLSSALTINPLLLTFAVASIAAHRRALASPLLGYTGLWLILGLFILCFARGWGASPLSDIAAALLVSHAGFLSLRLLLSPGDGDKVPGLFVLLTLSSALAVTVKLSALPVLGLVLVAGGSARHTLLKSRQPVILTLAACASLALVWLGRGVLLSGCVAYPAVQSCLPLPWTIPQAVAQSDLAAMRHYARVPGGDAAIPSDGWQWMGPWAMDGLPWIVGIAIALAILTSLTAVAQRQGRRLTWNIVALAPSSRSALVGLLLVLLCGVVFWFLTAPLWRYGVCFLVPLLALLAGLVSPSSSPRAWTPGWNLRAMALVVPVILLLTADIGGMAGFGRNWPVSRQSAISSGQSRHGALVMRPQADDRCWAARRPCTPTPDADLRMTSIHHWRAAIHDPT